MRRCGRAWIVTLVVALGWAGLAASAAKAGSVVLVGRITSKAGPTNARVWAITLFNDGSTTANNARIDGLTLTQISGPACTPIVSGPAFPLALGNIAPAGSASGLITFDFTGCSDGNRFRVNVPYSADAGAENGAIVRYNLFR